MMPFAKPKTDIIGIDTLISFSAPLFFKKHEYTIQHFVKTLTCVVSVDIALATMVTISSGFMRAL